MALAASYSSSSSMAGPSRLGLIAAASSSSLPRRSSTRPTISPPTALAPRRSNHHRSSIRAYRYHVDVHGQLFLHDTVPKNLSSCYKNPAFLDFFFARVRRNDRVSAQEEPLEHPEPDWVDSPGLDEQTASSLAHRYGYHWLSPCQGEFNFTRADATPIVFRELSSDGKLSWAGSYQMDFEPARLKVCRDTGYVYHPSPRPPLSRYRKDASLPTPYGPYSLLGSSLVLQRLTEGLDVDPEAFSQGKGGSIEWLGQRHDMGVIEQGDLVLPTKSR